MKIKKPLPSCFISERRGYNFNMVEAAGVEPASETHESNKPTSVFSA